MERGSIGSLEQVMLLIAVLSLGLLLLSIGRSILLNSICSIYVTIVHRPFVGSPIALLTSAAKRPQPATDSWVSRIWIVAAVQRLAHRKSLHHERQIDWTKSDQPKEGDLIQAWDRVVEWDDRCIHPQKLQSLRTISDKLADDALENDSRQSHKVGSTDTLERIYDQATRQDEAPDADILRFWNAVNRRPPVGAGALSLEWYRSYKPDAVNLDKLDRWPKVPTSSGVEDDPFPPCWQPESQPKSQRDHESRQEIEAEAEVLRRGQDVFYKYAGPMLLSLLHFSLAGGFSSPRITEVLRQTAYLVPNSHKRRSHDVQENSQPNGDAESKGFAGLPKMDKARADRTWSRLLETTQFVLDVMESVDSMRPPNPDEAPSSGGQGWQSTVRVRLLHTAVRRRVLISAQKGDRSKGLAYDLEKNGVPINQEDLVATLCAFSSAPLASLQRMGISPTLQEREDFIALWRHVGFYMGVEPALLRTCFKDAAAADRTLWCATLHLFGEMEIGSNLINHNGAAERQVQGPTIPVLIACSDRPPFHTPLGAHFAISRHLLGKSLADTLGIPATRPLRQVITDVAFLGMKVPIVFGRFYRKGWEKRRLELARPLLRRLIVWSFGNKRTKFEMPSPTTASGQNHVQANKDARQEHDEDNEDGQHVETQSQPSSLIDIPENKAENLHLARQWSWLMREMIAVLVVSAISVLAITILLLVRIRI